MERKKVYKVICTNTIEKVVHEKISCVMNTLSGTLIEKRGFRIIKFDNRMVFKVKTTKSRYLLMRKHIESMYPNICSFNI